jgi:hypothetical protein
MDVSLDELIKVERKNKQQQQKKGGAAAKTKAAKAKAGKGPAGKQGKAGKAAKGSAQLKSAVGKKQKTKGALKAGKMDVDMKPAGKGAKKKKGAGGAAKAGGKVNDTLKARIQAAVARRGGKVQAKQAAPKANPKDIKITIMGRQNSGAFTFNKPGRGQNRGGAAAGRGRGGIIKPGMQKAKAGLQGIGKKVGKARKVVVGGGRAPVRAPGGPKANKGPAGKGGRGRGGANGGRGAKPKFGKNTLAAKLMGKKKK